MTKTPLLSLILPAYNEEERLLECLQKVNSFISNQPYEIEALLIENGSHDNTLKIAQEFAQTVPWLKVFSESKPGKGRAVRRGMMEATGDYCFFADVDFSMPVEEIARFLPPQAPHYDVAIGSREAPGAKRYNEPAFRHFTGRVFNAIVRVLAVKDLNDTQCGFKCFTREAAKSLFSIQKIDGWAFDAEVLFIAQRYGYKIVEIPVNWYYDGQSKINLFKDAIKMFNELMQIRKNYRSGCYDKERKTD